MTADAALDCLRRMLADLRFDEDAPSLGVIWSAVRTWAAIPVDGLDGPDADRMLYETDHAFKPASAGSNASYYWLGFTRQFLREDSAGYPAIEQVLVECWYDPHPDFVEAVALERQEGHAEPGWGVAGALDEAWCGRVDRDPGLLAGVRHAPRTVRLSQGLL